MKRSIIRTQTIFVENCGAKGYRIDPIVKDQNIAHILRPVDMIVNRLTFQLIRTGIGDGAVLLISTNPPTTSYDGIQLVNLPLPEASLAGDVYIPVKWTFENFNDAGIEDSFYLAACNGTTGDGVYVCIIYEGAIK